MATIAIIAAGTMGSAVGRKLKNSGCTVLTNLEGRSEATHRRARDAGMEDVSMTDIVLHARWVLSILPPINALAFAKRFLDEFNRLARGDDSICFVDCNAVNPDTVNEIAGLFSGAKSPITFIDAAIIGGPPTDSYNPTFYASAAQKDQESLDHFSGLSNYGLKITPLKGHGASIGDASALKMSYAGITKGTTGLFTTMILAAHASSPATAGALMHELHISQPVLLQRITRAVPPMLPKAYRWVGEMEEIADFVGTEREIYNGLAQLYRRIEKSVKDDDDDVKVLNKFVEDAKTLGH